MRNGTQIPEERERVRKGLWRPIRRAYIDEVSGKVPCRAGVRR